MVGSEYIVNCYPELSVRLKSWTTMLVRFLNLAKLLVVAYIWNTLSIVGGRLATTRFNRPTKRRVSNSRNNEDHRFLIVVETSRRATSVSVCQLVLSAALKWGYESEITVHCDFILVLGSEEL